jgi:1,4-alpha-glucan branching enzyme
MPLVPVANNGSADNAVTSYTFLLTSASAKKVVIVGDFNDWNEQGTPLARASNDGVWSVTVPLRAGRYAYQFVVDDTLRLTDPRLPIEADEFGTANSFVTIPVRAP